MKSLLFVVAALAACAPAAQTYRGSVNVRSAELLPLDPDIKVVADSDQPMFYAVGSYWLFHDAGWYRAASARGSAWVKVEKPPWQVRKIDQPYAFTRFEYEKGDQTASAQVLARPVEVPDAGSAPAAPKAKPGRDEPSPAQPASRDL
ncbi:MAG: hypothetical protein ABI867_26860, partial [Kofleriaceae bacterium]